MKQSEAALMMAPVFLASWQLTKQNPKAVMQYLEKQGFSERQRERICKQAVHYARRIREIDHPLMNLVEFGIYDHAEEILELVETAHGS